MNTLLGKTVVCCVRVDKGAAMLDVNHGSAHRIIHNMLQVFCKVVPRQVTPELKGRFVDACQELLRQYEIEGDGFLKHVSKWK
jgi:hypothetical protein